MPNLTIFTGDDDDSLRATLNRVKQTVDALEKRTARTELAINDHAQRMMELHGRIYGDEGQNSMVEEVEDMLTHFRKELLQQRNGLTTLTGQTAPISDEVGALRQEIAHIGSQFAALQAEFGGLAHATATASTKGKGGGRQSQVVVEEHDPQILAALNRFDKTILEMQNHFENFKLEVLAIAERWKDMFVGADKVGDLLAEETREYRLITEQAVIKAGFLAITCSECTPAQRMTMFDMLLVKEQAVQKAQQEAAAEVEEEMEEFQEQQEEADAKIWPPANCNFLVKVDKSGDKELGLEVEANRDHGVVEVMQVTRGLVNQWNQRHPNKTVGPGDWIIGANGVTLNYQEVLLELTKRQELEIAILKPQDQHRVKDPVKFE
mmetsp:Transcript_59749/g.142165  ORF Transcript_59749/g.142165 Transcript_59749/m.142165 type:complete len:379 (+) Transcript_59749:86-1222(+)